MLDGLQGYTRVAGHPVGPMITARLMSRFKPERFWVDVIPFSHETDKYAHYAEETGLLMEYASKYGEFSSFNGMKMKGLAGVDSSS